MDENEFEGSMKDIGGKIQDAAGGLTGDSSTQAKGKWNQATGQAQKNFGAASDQIRENVTAQPLMAIGVAAGVAFLLGFLIRR